MEYATIKIPAGDIKILKKMQQRFHKQGIDITQEELVGSAVELAAEEEDWLLKRIESTQVNEGNELLKELIAKPFEGGELTNSVEEHDVVS